MGSHHRVTTSVITWCCDVYLKNESREKKFFCSYFFEKVKLRQSNDVRQRLRIQSKEYWAQDRTLRNPIMKLLLWRDTTVDADRLESIRQIWWKLFKSLARYAKHVIQTCKANAVVQNIVCDWQIEYGQMGTWPSSTLPRRQFVTSRRAVCTVMCTVCRLEGLWEIVGQQIAAKLMQHNLLQHLGKKWQIWHRPIVFFRLLASRPVFLRRGITTASLNCQGTDPDSSESFTILQIKGTKSSKYFFSKVVGMGSSTQLLESYFDYINPHCDLDIEHSEPIFLHVTLAYDAA